MNVRIWAQISDRIVRLCVGGGVARVRARARTMYNGCALAVCVLF